MNSKMTKLQQVGFTFPAAFGKSKHPFLDATGNVRDPETIGFERVTIGGGTPALCFEHGRFNVTIVNEDGCGIPELADWQSAVIAVDVDACTPYGYDVVEMSALEWEGF